MEFLELRINLPKSSCVLTLIGSFKFAFLKETKVHMENSVIFGQFYYLYFIQNLNAISNFKDRGLQFLVFNFFFLMKNV